MQNWDNSTFSGLNFHEISKSLSTETSVTCPGSPHRNLYMVGNTHYKLIYLKSFK